MYLLAAALLFVASGVLAAAPHDHDPNECCRTCAFGERIEAPVVEVRAESPQLEATAAPTLTAAVDTSIGLLLAKPLRGPPLSS